MLSPGAPLDRSHDEGKVDGQYVGDLRSLDDDEKWSVVWELELKTHVRHFCALTTLPRVGLALIFIVFVLVR